MSKRKNLTYNNKRKCYKRDFMKTGLSYLVLLGSYVVVVSLVVQELECLLLIMTMVPWLLGLVFAIITMTQKIKNNRLFFPKYITLC